MQTILVVTTEDDSMAAARWRAAELAAGAESRVILYDLDAAGWASPLPTGWSADGEGPRSDPLDAHELEVAGRHAIARQVAELTASGMTAFGWLPGAADWPTLAAYAKHHDATTIVLPVGSHLAQAAQADEDPLIELVATTEGVAQR